jgi:hypothetical protein
MEVSGALWNPTIDAEGPMKLVELRGNVLAAP